MNLIFGFPGYWATEDGRIWSSKRAKFLKPAINDGYKRVGLHRNGERFTKKVHTLVALSFLGPRPDGLEVRHLNGDKTNNHVSNLKYGTRSENRRDRLTHGTDHEASKTHCKQRHEYSPENTYHPPGKPNHRQCRQCHCLREQVRRGRP